MAKLWSKGYELDSLIEAFTVGQDPVLDKRLVAADCASSMAHAKMLAKIGILSGEEANSLIGALNKIAELNEEDKFVIEQADEDCHTAIEKFLTAELGDAGKKIHTGRSRNDQVTCAIRLYAKESALRIAGTALDTAEAFLDFAKEYLEIPMPGRTHMQKAMPSTVGLWSASFAEELLDGVTALSETIKIQDKCPLGAAAGYGVPLPLDREFTAKLLGFSAPQNNVIYVNNSRGKTEAMLLDCYEYIALALGKFAQDSIMFSLPEFSYFKLPDELCTGSSIMPQKKNPDGLELLRGKTALIGSYAMTVKNIIRSLPSGYNRDFQETKGPFIYGTEQIELCLLTASRTLEKMEVNEGALTKAFTPEIYATDLALDKVAAGEAFRDAYKYAAAHQNELTVRDPREIIKKRVSSGTPGNPNLAPAYDQLAALKNLISRRIENHKKARKGLSGREILICRSAVCRQL